MTPPAMDAMAPEIALNPVTARAAVQRLWRRFELWVQSWREVRRAARIERRRAARLYLLEYRDLRRPAFCGAS